MDPVIIISIVSAILFVGVIASASLKPIKWLGSGAVRILIGAIALFVINLFGNLAGIHMPINLFTSSVAGILVYQALLCSSLFITSCFLSKIHTL